MAPVPAPKKVWIHDGRITRYPSVLTSNSVHRGRSCTDCHGGVDGRNSRDAAHIGFRPISVASSCTPCHDDKVNTAGAGLHTTLAGYTAIMRPRGFNENDPVTMERFEEQCTKCHTAVGTTPPETACGHCHVSVPSTAGGGLLAAHACQRTPSMGNNCTACHGSRVKDEYYGSNNTLLASNKPHLTTGLPWKEAAYTLQPDVHWTAGQQCTFCHSADEMHGQGAPADGDRYEVTTAPTCDATGCHTGMVGLNALHTATHLDTMSCQVCHSQPYKNCFECHTDLTSEGLPFYSISDNAPGGEHEHLMTFRVGNNPRYQPGGSEKKYAVLRHVPVDADVFTYTGSNAQPGLLPTLTALPTWKYASPHNIQRVTPIQSACANCHAAEYAKFWLTDAVQNAEGWISPSREMDEVNANTDVVVNSPIPTDRGPSR